ncbi:MAG: YkgJ family cysteine cluster protein [Planctomycetota bacterium]
MASEVLGSALRVIQDSPQYGQFDCKAGCAFCCHTAITVATPEAVAVSDFVRRHFDDDATAKLRERLTSNADLAANVSRDEYIAKRVPCAMLSEDANCLVHPVRPLACAGFLSTSASRCEDTYVGKPGADPSPGDRHAMAAGLGTSFGLKQACRDSGRDGEFYELHHAVLRLLDAPDAGRRWLDGESVLQGCMT